LRLTASQSIYGLDCGHSFNRQVGISRRSARPSGQFIGRPVLDGLGTDPDSASSPFFERGVILAPVADGVRGFLFHRNKSISFHCIRNSSLRFAQQSPCAVKITRTVLKEGEVIGLVLYLATKLRCQAINITSPILIKTGKRKHGDYSRTFYFFYRERGLQPILQSWAAWLGMDFATPWLIFEKALLHKSRSTTISCGYCSAQSMGDRFMRRRPLKLLNGKGRLGL
jgi:hypothetical protein